MLASLSDPQTWIALFTLTSLEMVLGIDNIIFISILAGKLPAHQQGKARQTGLLLAMGTRVLLLLSLSWLIRLTTPLFELPGLHIEITGKGLILLVGGLFLLGKSTFEIHDKLEGVEGHAAASTKSTLRGVITQIVLLDVVFSLDSVITAVGLVQELWVMITAVVLAVVVMLFTAKPLGDFVDQHPTLKILALSFLLLIGFSLVAEGLEFHIPKGYIYFAMGFSVFVEIINLRLRARKAEPVRLRNAYVETQSGD